MSSIGTFFGACLAIAHRYLKVEEDPRLDIVEEMLPGTNCGACGTPGCRAFSESIVSGDQQPSECTVASAGDVDIIANFLGVEAGEQDKLVARIHCAGGLGFARQIAEYEGYSNCRAAHLVGGGGKGCSWGCLGLDDCMIACDFDAIQMNEHKLPVVNVENCTACNDCVEACPRDLFDLMPLSQKLIVQCNAPLEGDDARAVCTVCCDGCERCAADSDGKITMGSNLPIIDWSSATEASPKATWRCPTGAIKWVEDGQFVQATIEHSIRKEAAV
ncbi:4Fe-4S binding protein [PVC group bacterium]|nr:4Fe-4S binding protein [PVC group bacterium]